MENREFDSRHRGSGIRLTCSMGTGDLYLKRYNGRGVTSGIRGTWEASDFLRYGAALLHLSFVQELRKFSVCRAKYVG